MYMKAHKALEFENNYKEISENVLSSIEFLKCIRFEDGGIEDYQCVEELINVLEIIFGGLENYNTMDDIKEILDVKEIIKYARKNC